MTKEFEPFYQQNNTKEFNVWDFEQPQVINEADLEAKNELLNECELLKQQAKESGYAEGMQQAQEAIDAKKAELIYWIDLLQKPIQLMDEQLVEEIIQTMIWLAEHCIGVELSVKPELLRTLFNEIKNELPMLHEKKKFAMHPDDVAWIKSEYPEQEIPGLHQLLQADPSLSRGDFYISGDHSELDGRIKVRLATLFAKYVNKDLLLSPMPAQEP